MRTRARRRSASANGHAPTSRKRWLGTMHAAPQAGERATRRQRQQQRSSQGSGIQRVRVASDAVLTLLTTASWTVFDEPRDGSLGSPGEQVSDPIQRLGGRSERKGGEAAAAWVARATMETAGAPVAQWQCVARLVPEPWSQSSAGRRSESSPAPRPTSPPSFAAPPAPEPRRGPANRPPSTPRAAPWTPGAHRASPAGASATPLLAPLRCVPRQRARVSEPRPPQSPNRPPTPPA